MDQIRMCGVKKQHIFLMLQFFTWCVLELVGPVQDLRDLYGPVCNGFDAGRSITWASWKGLGHGN